MVDRIMYYAFFIFMSVHYRTAGWVTQEDATQGGPDLRKAFGSPLPPSWGHTGDMQTRDSGNLSLPDFPESRAWV